jgi:integrase/recombinase XerD
LEKHALASYAKFKKLKIEWERIVGIIPKIQKKFFPTINEEELNLLKKVRFEENDKVYQRNNLMMDFLFYSGLRVSELVNIKHSDYQNNSLRIHGKGNKIRYVFLPEFLIKDIKLGSISYLFNSSKKKKISSKQVCKMICQRTKLTNFKK